MIKVIIASKRPFDVIGDSVRMIEHLTGAPVGIFEFSSSKRVRVSFINISSVMNTRVVSGEVGNGISEGGECYVCGEVAIYKEDA